MKKQILMLMLIGAMAFTACGNKAAKENNTDQMEESAGEADEENADDMENEIADSAVNMEDDVPITEDTIEEAGIDAFMTVGDYKGIELTKTVYGEATDEDVDIEIEYMLSNYPLSVNDENAVVAMGDVVNLDYSGSMDGVVFDGGTAEGYDLTIGSGSFIDDFEDQLVGMKVGEEGEVEVTFPDPYQNNPDYAGKDAVFAVKINEIKRTQTEATQEWLDQYAGGQTLEEYRASLKESITAANQSNAESAMQNEAWTAVCSTVEFLQFPQDELEACFDVIDSYYATYATMYGVSYDEFISAMGITEEALIEEAKNTLRNWMVIEYICIKEGITSESDAYIAAEKEAFETNGFASREDAIASGISEWTIDYTAKYTVVIDLIIENANITEVEA